MVDKADFETGDVVQLRSGGPQMTVVETVSDGSIRCCWFQEPVHKDQEFAPALLDLLWKKRDGLPKPIIV